MHTTIKKMSSDPQNQQILQWLSPRLHTLVEYMFSEPINELTFQDNSLYIHIWFGSGTISDYKTLLPDCFVQEKAGSFEGMSKFGGPSAYVGRSLDLVSSELGATLYLSYDAEHGISAKLWVEPQTSDKQ